MKNWVSKTLNLLAASLEPPKHELNELDWKAALSFEVFVESILRFALHKVLYGVWLLHKAPPRFRRYRGVSEIRPVSTFVEMGQSTEIQCLIPV
jgi:hypothetical protein